MKLFFNPKTQLERFGFEIFLILKSHFKETLFVGGMVRNLLLDEKVLDIDIATSATPQQVVSIFKKYNVEINDDAKVFGVIKISRGKLSVEVSTFRTEQYKKSNRFPNVKFVKSPKLDFKRRDFTINAIYHNPLTNEVFDYTGKAIKDTENRSLKVIGDAKIKFTEDPIRIIRAYRFSKDYNLVISKSLNNLLLQHSHLLKTISKNRIIKEINKSKLKSTKHFLKSYTQTHLT